MFNALITFLDWIPSDLKIFALAGICVVGLLLISRIAKLIWDVLPFV